jgi:hypothetical protein
MSHPLLNPALTSDRGIFPYPVFSSTSKGKKSYQRMKKGGSGKLTATYVADDKIIAVPHIDKIEGLV